jgi:hypothetical protein
MDRKRNIIVAGYPKSGNTWATRLVAEVIGCPVGGSWKRNTIDALEIEGQERNSDNVVYKSHFTRTALRGLEFSDRVIGIVRDPRDVVCSAANYFPLSIYEKMKGKKCDRYEAMVDVLINGGPYPYCRRSWNQHVRSFLDDQCLLIRYEDLHVKPLETINRILQYIHVERHPDSVSAAVEKQSFNQRKERAVREADSRNEHFLRKGKVGAFSEELTSAQIEQLQNACGSTMAQLGYIFV